MIFKNKRERSQLKANFSKDLAPASMKELSADKAELDGLLKSRVFQHFLTWVQEEQNLAKENIMNTFDNEETECYRIMYRMLKKFSMNLESYYSACKLAEGYLVENSDSSKRR